MPNEEIYQLLNDCLPKIFKPDKSNIEMFSLPIVGNKKEFVLAEVYILNEKRFFFTNTALHYKKLNNEKAYITKTLPYNEIKNIRCGEESVYILLHSNTWVIITIEEFDANELCYMLETIQKIYQFDIETAIQEDVDDAYNADDSDEENLKKPHRLKSPFIPLSSQDYDFVPYSRKAYEDTSKLNEYKKAVFGTRNSIQDEYNPNNTIHLKRDPALNKYGHEHYSQHACDADHINPVKKSVDDMDRSIAGNLLTHEQRREIINSDGNLALTNSSLNRSKGENSNAQYINEHPELDARTKETMSKMGADAQKNMKQSVRKQAIKNEVGRAGQAGAIGAISGALFEGYNQCKIQKEAVKNGEKTKKEAFKDGIKNTAIAAGESGAEAALSQIIVDLAIAGIKAGAKAIFKAK